MRKANLYIFYVLQVGLLAWALLVVTSCSYFLSYSILFYWFYYVW